MLVADGIPLVYSQCVTALSRNLFNLEYWIVYDVYKGSTVWTMQAESRRLHSSPKAAERVIKLQGAVQSAFLMSVESLTRELDENRANAKGLDPVAATNTAIMGKSRLRGLFKDKSDVAVTVKLVSLSRDIADV